MNIKRISFITLAVSVTALILRLVELFCFYDSGTGFFSENAILSWSSIVLILALLIYLALSHMKHPKFLGRVSDDYRSLPAGLAMLFSGIVTLLCSYYMYEHYIGLESSGIVEISATGLSLRLPFLIATVIFGAYMTVGSFALITGKNYLGKAKLLSLIAVLWALIYTLYVFVHYSVSSLMTENVFAVFSAIALSMFFLNEAKFISDVNTDGRALSKCIVYGNISASLLIPYSLSAIIYNLCGNEYKNMLPTWIHGILFCLGIFAWLFSYTVSFTKVEPETENNSGGKRYKRGSK